MWVKNAASEPERMLFKGAAANATSWSPDGQTLLYNESVPASGWDIWQFSTVTNQTTPFVQTSFNEVHGRFSPDGRSVAYSSDESGQWEVYLRPATGSGARVPLSTGGGFEPRWRGDGKEIFYLTPDRRIMAVDVRVTGGTFEAGTPRTLFNARIEALPAPLAVSNGYRRTYTVTPDARRGRREVAVSCGRALCRGVRRVVNVVRAGGFEPPTPAV